MIASLALPGIVVNVICAGNPFGPKAAVRRYAVADNLYRFIPSICPIYSYLLSRTSISIFDHAESSKYTVLGFFSRERAIFAIAFL
jgi:hypothetical protein